MVGAQRDDRFAPKAQRKHGTCPANLQCFTSTKMYLDFSAKLAIRDLQVVLGGAILVHERQETVLDVQELVVLALDDGDIHVVGGGGHIFQLLASEDINGRKVDL